MPSGCGYCVLDHHCQEVWLKPQHWWSSRNFGWEHALCEQVYGAHFWGETMALRARVEPLELVTCYACGRRSRQVYASFVTRGVVCQDCFMHEEAFVRRVHCTPSLPMRAAIRRALLRKYRIPVSKHFLWR